MKAFLAELKQTDAGRVMYDKPLSEYTTWKIGGPADVLIVPESKDQLVSVVKLLHKHEVQWTNIGRGSNMLVSDKGVRGVVIQPGADSIMCDLKAITFMRVLLIPFIKLSVMAGKEGLTGLEFAGGIPGSVGGAVYMNAGAHGSDVSRIFKSAEIVLETGELVSYTNRERWIFLTVIPSCMSSRGIVVEATFELAAGRSQRNCGGAWPLTKSADCGHNRCSMACAGSVFRNPPDDYAARLIQEAGLKGATSAVREVSEQHANFIVNTGQATAEDVLTLMAHIQSTIQSEYGIALVPEVLVVGER